jgi:hypothetical protein
MAFELWRQPDGVRTVEIRMYYPTLRNLRTLEGYSPAHPVPFVHLPIRGCGPDGVCRLDQLEARLTQVLAKDCLKPQ